MRALVCHGGDDLRVEELPEPSPGPGQVVLDVRLAGICGSDLHAYRGHPGPRRPPLVLGHEAVGTVGADGRFAVFPLAPIYVMVTAAFKTQRDFLAQPFAPSSIRPWTGSGPR